MTPQTLFDTLSSLSLHVQLDAAGAPEVIGDVSKLTDPVKQALRDHRQVFIDVLSQRSPLVAGPSTGRVRLGDQTHEYSLWNSTTRLNSPIAIDCETELIVDRQIPSLALVSVSDGTNHQFIHPQQLGAFIESHASCHFVAHNAAFDFAVIRQALTDASSWIDICHDGRLHDTMHLDALIRLARSDEQPIGRNLGTVAKAYLKISIDKNDPFRLRYGELVGKPWDGAEAGFFEYAIKDAIITWKLYRTLSVIAARLLAPFESQLLPDHRRRFGLLSESVQVRGAIALAAIERTGVSLDRSQVESTKRSLNAEVQKVLSRIRELPESEGLFKQDKHGELVWTKSGKPSINQPKLTEILDKITADHDIDAHRTPKTGEITTSLAFWEQYSERTPFLTLWIQLGEATKPCQFFSGLKSDQIHPRYVVIKRTGRTSCHKPNIQQLPRSGGFREMIIPSPGHYLLAIDYSTIELRTLAAICLQRYGHSQLADVINQGIDPHAFTAAMFEGVSLETFQNLPAKKELRQRAKALNFGIPGGLGAQALVEYANTTYGVTLSLEEAQRFRRQLIEDVYPELSEYLQDDLIAALAYNLKATAFRVRYRFPTGGTIGAAKRIVAGQGRANGDAYSETFVNRVWESLTELNQDSSLRERLAQRVTGEQICRDLFSSPVCTLTGRIRGAVGFAQARNTPFQGLAADGAKLALWELYRAGFRCVAFVHDEVLIEIPIASDHTDLATRIDTILCDSMRQLTGEVPIACAYALVDRWYKQAEAIFDENGRLQLWQPNSY